ncbi:S9 family peptidase [Nitrosovibrio sp. Nv17]|uniref:S9 family peptidase n=1 Tax=Nitrosovibrio sp. Nv17 TaxID=1855339 RepID=UPI0009086B14|nr:S9 family peptidase [Nitrosovibrio sp. Nv17]SFW17485.1 Dipeptidyl aminopeptidase/acylaminoacyl peptidase [Nitrosovibrio sp. Nv17]
MATTSMLGASFSMDERRILFSSNASGIFNVYALPFDGGDPQPLTRSTLDSTFSVSFFPTDDRILFTRDRGGDEHFHLYLLAPGGVETDLTPGSGHKAQFMGWRADGSAFFVSSNERDPRFFDIYRYDARTCERILFYRNEHGFDLGPISRDERWVALNRNHTPSDGDIYLFDVVRGTLRHLTPHATPVGFRAETFDPASRKLLFLTNETGEFKRLCSLHLETGDIREHERADWDVAYTSYSRDGRFRVTGINRDGRIAVRIVEVDGDREKPVRVPRLPAGEIRGVAFSASGTRMAFYLNSDRAPDDLFVHELRAERSGGRNPSERPPARRLTRNLGPDIDTADLVEAEVVRFRSFDGTVIPSIYYRPLQASARDKVPAIVYVHGGPGGQTMRGYNAQFQYLANHGYAVLGINNRGSSGYGKTFFAAANRRHGREPLWDCVEARTWLASLGHVDHERIGIMGASYGGYMVLAALAFRPEVFKVGVDIFGVSNWLRTLESIPPYWESVRKAIYAEIGDPVHDIDRLVATSPLFHAREIRRPLMVIQGVNDPRVTKAESDGIVEAVRQHGVPVEYLVFDDEGHGFTKKKNQIEANRRILAFLDRHLKGGGAAAGG